MALPARPVGPETAVVSVAPAVPERLIPIPPASAPPIAPAADAVAPAELRAFLAAPDGRVQVGRLGRAVLGLLGGASGDVLLSAETMRKQRKWHGEGPDDLYSKPLQRLLRKPEVVLENKAGHLRLLGRSGKTGLTAVIKRTRDASETYLLSFHKVRRVGVEEFLAKHRVVAGSADDLLTWMRKRAR